VREAWRADVRYDKVAPRDIPPDSAVMYEADEGLCKFPLMTPGKLRPSIFMPRWACRILLEVTELRIQQLQAISNEDAGAEGVLSWIAEVSRAEAQADIQPAGLMALRLRYPDGMRGLYAMLWDSINGAGSWDLNPWVWAVSFKRLTP
jgi:hypothetical protein